MSSPTSRTRRSILQKQSDNVEHMRTRTHHHHHNTTATHHHATTMKRIDSKEKTVEPHIMHEFKEDFYGCKLKLLVCARLRDEKNFDSMDALIEAIQQDIRDTDVCLDKEQYKVFQNHEHFRG